ncbi:arginine--tRNA ligase, partial [Candidatus Pacebacteria bacterium]|nr:arginine--tRNA ligase [Candidatus Paceibacterota bacterium]
MKEILENEIRGILTGLGLEEVPFVVEHPSDFSNGDYSTNVAMLAAKSQGKNPKEVAEQISKALGSVSLDDIDKVEVAGPGFINIYLSKKFFETAVREVINQGSNYGLNERLEKQKTIIEFTDPNPFKKFHIGHMMSNSIGEALCRISEWNGADVKRMVYQGDIGLHIAKAVWGMVQNRAAFPHDEDSNDVKVRFLSNAYAFGAKEYESDERAKKEIIVTNKMLFEKSNHELNIYYEKGRKWSLEEFEKIYKRLGTKFDFQILESEMAELAKSTVMDGLEKNIFEESDGAIVYKGEKVGLHTRVFINSNGLPVYEAKELALASAKEKLYPYEKSIIVTGNEIAEYFKVVMAAMKETFPEKQAKTTHLPHGMLRLPSGKMSSRTGSVIAAEDLIDDVRDRVIEKMSNSEKSQEFSNEEKKNIAEDVAVAAIKYSILKQAPGRDIIFDIDKSLSFEGDSGPYLQYTAIRSKSILEKADAEGVPVSNVT